MKHQPSLLLRLLLSCLLCMRLSNAFIKTQTHYTHYGGGGGEGGGGGGGGGGEQIQAMVEHMLESNVYPTMDTLYDDVEGLKENWASQLNAFKQSTTLALQSIRDAFEARLNSMTSQMQALQHKMDVQMQSLTSSSSSSSCKSVAFTAKLGGETNKYYGVDVRETVYFKDIISNIGNAYNPDQGTFTAPVPGTYVFFLQMMGSHAANEVVLAIFKNGNQIGEITTYGGKMKVFNDKGSTEVVVQMSRGDKVTVKAEQPGPVRGKWSLFTGFLLCAD